MPEEKNKGGRGKTYSDEDFLKVLSSTPMTTGQVRTELKKKRKYKNIIHDTVLKNLLRLSEEGIVNKQEVPAASRTGIMYLWTLTDAGKKKLDEMKKD